MMSESNPSISLIMTVFNRSNYVYLAVESVLLQTYTNFELILWDDGSTDGSDLICEEMAETDARIRFVRSHHQGRVQSLLGAHALARGDYLGWVDSDDLLMPTALAETWAYLENNQDIGLVYTQYETLDPTGINLGLGYRCHIPYDPVQMLVAFMVFHFRLIRRAAFEAAGGINPFFEAAVDYDLCLRISEVAYIHHIPKPLYLYRLHPNCMSAGSCWEKQKDFAVQAVKQALSRRGWDNLYELNLNDKNEFVLYSKPQCPKVCH